MNFPRIVITAGALLVACALAQESKDPVTEKLLREAAEKGFKLSADLNVASSVSVEAVLLPPNVTRGLFGRAMSDRYAAVELIVSNRSHDAALIVHTIFLDYSRWLLSSIAVARKNGTRIVLTGEQFVNLKACGKELKFEVAEPAAGSAFKGVENFTAVSAEEVSFDLPKTPADGKLKVRVLVAGVEADSRNVE